jgi:uncharacterized protein YggE
MAIARPLALAAALLVALPALSQEAGLVNRTPNIAVPVRLTEEVKPDIAILSLAAMAERRTATEAANEVAKAGQAIIAELKGQGIAETDIRTRDVSITPTFRQELDSNGRPTGRQTLTGYRAVGAGRARARHDTRRTHRARSRGQGRERLRGHRLRPRGS